jgi:hypothetical protein
MTKQTLKMDSSIIFIYSRRDAIHDGVQIDVSRIAREAGIRYPTFITQGAYGQFVAVPPGVECQDESGRLWDVVWMLAYAIRQTDGTSSRLPFQLYVRNSNDDEPTLVTLLAVCGPLDFDDPQPTITIMLPDED